MKFEKKQLDNHQVEIIVETDEEQFKKSKGKAAREISKESKIPGFRPGKAPYDVVERIYGEDYIEERAVELVINELYPQIIKEADIKPYGPGKLDEILEKNPPKFQLTIPLEPVVELADYKTLKVPYKLPKTTAKDIDEVLKNLQTNYATAEEVDRPSASGDLVTAVINAELTKPDKDQDAQILKDTPHQAVLGENTDEEQFPFKGFSDNLIGMSVGEEKEFSHKYPKDSEYEHLRGKEVQFKVRLETVKKLIKPELNDEFAQTLGLDDLKTVKESIKLQLETEKRNEYDNEYYDELLDKLVKKSVVKYPPLALEDEIKDVVTNFEANLAKQNLDLDTYLKINTRKEEDFMENDIKPAAQKRLEQALVMDEVSRIEKIELDQNELQQEYARSFMQMQSGPDFQKLQKQFTTQKLANATVMQAASRLMNQKTLERLKDYASGEMEAREKEAKEKEAAEKKAKEDEAKVEKETAEPKAEAKPAKKKAAAENAAAEESEEKE
ncbi:MAG: trigger factor [Chloroflexota bacterium]|nr:trigger factor [Chloroflexota bacterium]